MLYAKRTVRCSARNLNRADAKRSLESQFKDSEVLELNRSGDKWVATLLEPKTAEFPPPKDDDETSAPPEAKDDSEESDTPDGPPKDDAPEEGDGPPKPEGPKGEKAEITALLDLVHQIADKLGIMPGPAAPGAEDGPLPDGPMPPPPGPPGIPHDPGVGGEGHQEIVHRTKLKPGDTPPGVTPIGTPAFASTHEASTLSRMASFDAFDDTPNKSIREAKAELEALYGPHGFKVRQIKRVDNGRRLAAKLSRR
jgi:hypothetical protein